MFSLSLCQSTVLPKEVFRLRLFERDGGREERERKKERNGKREREREVIITDLISYMFTKCTCTCFYCLMSGHNVNSNYLFISIVGKLNSLSIISCIIARVILFKFRKNVSTFLSLQSQQGDH